MKVKSILLSLALCTISSISYCQAGGSDGVQGLAASARVQSVARYMNSTLIDGQTMKQISRMGDSAAVAVTKVIGNNLVSTAQQLKILEILRMAFERPSILETSDRQPQTTLFLLNFLEASAIDQTLKNGIADTRKFVVAAGGHLSIEPK